jgi:cyclic pyranopterin phosphate synthase
LPNGYLQPEGEIESELSILEIQRLVKAFSKLGFSKVRLTGGEPTVRRDIVDIAHAISNIRGIDKVALTTNGSRLTELAMPLRLAGVSAINISMDSLDENTFNARSGVDRFQQVMEGVERAELAGFESIKINAVLFKNTHEKEITRFMEWVKTRPISVRFIELMKNGSLSGEYFSENHVTGGTVQFALQKAGWKQTKRHHHDGPAVVYRHPESVGSIGIIAPYSSDFCESCNRLRVNARGALRLCLFGEGEISLRKFLQDDHSEEQLIQFIQESLKTKPISHQLQEGKYGINQSFSHIGG